jgi:hypothetical protein
MASPSIARVLTALPLGLPPLPNCICNGMKGRRRLRLIDYMRWAELLIYMAAHELSLTRTRVDLGMAQTVTVLHDTFL